MSVFTVLEMHFFLNQSLVIIHIKAIIGMVERERKKEITNTTKMRKKIMLNQIT